MGNDERPDDAVATEEQPFFWSQPPVILAENIDTVVYSQGYLRVLCTAWMIDSAASRTAVCSGALALTHEAALDLRSKLDQMLLQMDQKGVAPLPKGPLQG